MQVYKKNDRVTVTIEDIGVDGEGIGKIDGYTLFVKDAVIGDVAQVKIMKAKKNYGYARLEKVVTPSPFRVEAKCPVASRCGGCQLQAMAYEKQLEYKEKKVFHDLVRIGGFSADFVKSIMEPIIGMEDPYGYRNKSQYPVGTDKDGNLVAGFYAGRTHAIIPAMDCAIGQPCNEGILSCVLSYMKKYHIPAYDETTHQGLVRHVLIRSGRATGEVMVCLIINGENVPNPQVLVDMLLDVPMLRYRITSVCISSNTQKTNVIMGDTYRVLYGVDYITDTIGDVAFQISPLSFYQVNPQQTVRLYEQALAYANLTGEETVWDLYCGIGTISLFLAQKAKQVYGVEIVPQAIQNAKANAKLNHMDNVEFYVGKAEEVLPEQYEKNHIYADVITVDPPRKGCDEKCLETMVKMQPKRIVYVSCDPATLARDLKYLCANGYELMKVRPVDNFPQTSHVEVVCVLDNQKYKEPSYSIDLTIEAADYYRITGKTPGI